MTLRNTSLRMARRFTRILPPGNKDGGITTLEDKSLGCTQKSGSSLVKGVLAYAEPVNTKGLNLLQRTW